MSPNLVKVVDNLQLVRDVLDRLEEATMLTGKVIQRDKPVETLGSVSMWVSSGQFRTSSIVL